MARGRHWALLCAMGILLVGCHDGGSAGPPVGAASSTTAAVVDSAASTRPQEATLMGRSFVGTAATENGRPHPFGSGTTIRMRFQEGGVRYTVGCNLMAAWVDLAAGRVTLRDGAQTLVGCGGSRGADEVWLRTLMESRPEWSLGDMQLTLRTPNAVLMLLDRRVAEPNRALEQPTHWLLRSIAAAGDTAVVPADKLPFIEFVGGRFFGGTTCNDISGNVLVGVGTLELSGLQVGPIPCTEPMATVERRLLALLDGPVSANVSGDTLVITKSDGLRADLVAQDDGY